MSTYFETATDRELEEIQEKMKTLQPIVDLRK